MRRTELHLSMNRPRAIEALGELYEPQLIAMSLKPFTLTGYERIGDQGYAQRLASAAFEMVPGEEAQVRIVVRQGSERAFEIGYRDTMP